MKCGFYEKEITPPLGISVPGYFCARPAYDVWDKLYAKAAVFTGSNGTVAVLILDAVQVKEEFCRKVTARIVEMTDIPADAIVIAATHTHYGVPFGDSVAEGGPYINEPDNDYLKVLERLAADTVILAWKHQEECTLEYATGWEDQVAFVRDYVMKDGTVCTNPSKRRVADILRPYDSNDPETPVLLAKNAEGKLLGCLFTHTCHQDTVGSWVISGDYSSEVSRQLKAAYGQDFVSVYMAGCCGDINHYDPIGGTKRSYIEIGQEVAKAVKAAIDEKRVPVTGEQVAFLRRDVPVFRRKADPEFLENCRKTLAGEDVGMDMGWAISIVGYEDRNLPDEINQPVQILRIGEVWFFALPGEVYHVFGQRIRAEVPGEKWLITELNGTESSYMPVPEVFGTDVYPEKLTDGSFLEPAAGDKLVAAVCDMITQMK